MSLALLVLRSITNAYQIRNRLRHESSPRLPTAPDVLRGGLWFRGVQRFGLLHVDPHGGAVLRLHVRRVSLRSLHLYGPRLAAEPAQLWCRPVRGRVARLEGGPGTAAVEERGSEYEKSGLSELSDDRT